MLHLLDEAGPRATPALCAAVAAAARGQGARVLLFGGPRLLRMAEAGGLRPDAVLQAPLGKPWLAPSAARRMVAGFRPAALTAWSADSLRFAKWFLPRLPVTAASPVAQAASVVAVQMSPTLGIPTVALVGRRADAWRGLNAAGIFDMIRGTPPTAAPRHRLLVHPDQAGLPHAKRQARNFGHPERLLVSPLMETPWRLPEDCAAILALSSPQGPDADQIVALPALAAAGRAIVAEDTPALRALCQGPRVRFAPAGDVPALADALAQTAA